MKMPLRAILAVAALTLLLGCQGEDAPTTDLVLKNSGTVGISRVEINGVVQGSLAPGGVMTFDDIGNGTFLIQAFVGAEDRTPCATYETPVLHRGEAVHHALDCGSTARPQSPR